MFTPTASKVSVRTGVVPDIFTKSKRSDVMSRIRGAGNKATELRLIGIFRANGITGWRRGQTLPLKSQGSRNKHQEAKPTGTARVKPDFVFRSLRVAVFVDGCFWHGCPVHGTKPKTRAKFWREKIARNHARDRRVDRALRRRGWVVLRIWEHSLTRRAEAGTVRRLKVRLLRRHEAKLRR
jgi:DNA mismatch endonuclease, patch repair protein